MKRAQRGVYFKNESSLRRAADEMKIIRIIQVNQAGLDATLCWKKYDVQRENKEKQVLSLSRVYTAQTHFVRQCVSLYPFAAWKLAVFLIKAKEA